MTENRYQLDNEWDHARERLRSLERIHDTLSIGRLEQVGAGPGWNCLELGPGGGSMTEWLLDRVGETGSVCAVDIDPRFVEAIDHPALTVKTSNVVEEPIDEGSYDLVFTRMTLQHIAERDAVLVSLVDGLKPGGWIVVHELDSSGRWREATTRFVKSLDDPERTAFERETAAAAELGRRSGRDSTHGGRVYGQLQSLGLVDLVAESSNQVIAAGSLLPSCLR